MCRLAGVWANTASKVAVSDMDRYMAGQFGFGVKPVFTNFTLESFNSRMTALMSFKVAHSLVFLIAKITGKFLFVGMPLILVLFYNASVFSAKMTHITGVRFLIGMHVEDVLF